MRLKNRRGGLDVDQDNHGCRNGYRRCRVHHDAQRAVVGIGIERVNVGHLGHGQERQQDQAHNGDGRPGSQPGAAIPA
jgi:hypothetical protein